MDSNLKAHGEKLSAITPISRDQELQDVVEKVHAGRRLDFEDGIRLFRSSDLHTIGELADHVRRKKHGRQTFYNINRHINYTNYCILHCKFCSFYRPVPGTRAALESPYDDGYELSVEQVVDLARESAKYGATEVHIVGGLHPTLPFDYYLDMCRGIREACPQLHIKAFTAIEIIHFARIARPRLTIREVLERLREAGLDSLPGGGAEIFDPRVHEETFKNKVGEKDWFDVHRIAHQMGMYTNATMLYGHVEKTEERINHLIKLREHQDTSLSEGEAAFNCIVPLSFIPSGSELAHLPGPTGIDDLRTLAVCRLMLDNIPHVKAFWVMQTAKLSQVSLSWGVDDLDGTVIWYDITRDRATGGTHQEMTVDDITRLITETGMEPVERDTLYRPVRRQAGKWWVEQ
jgi:aminodeoxyfutalosine synthase